MLMAAERTALGGPLRVVLATTHLALRDVPAALSADLLVRQATLTARALRDLWGIASPRIALCAVNPHASDGGLFGDEEARLVEPALAALAEAAGIDAWGPIPADTVFTRAVRGEFDAVIAPYHDVGMAAFKTAAFGSGVNVTLGLPFPRTSPTTARRSTSPGRAWPTLVVDEGGHPPRGPHGIGHAGAPPPERRLRTGPFVSFSPSPSSDLCGRGRFRASRPPFDRRLYGQGSHRGTETRRTAGFSLCPPCLRVSPIRKNQPAARPGSPQKGRRFDTTGRRE
jgi:hypothetical protein